MDIKKTPIRDINILEIKGYDNFLNISGTTKEFISKVEGLSIMQDTHIGHIYAKTSLDQADIISFIINKKFRRKSFGTILFKKFISNMKINGIQSIFLEVSKKNIVAQKFYYKLGFKIVGYRKNYYKVKNGKQDAYLLNANIKNII